MQYNDIWGKPTKPRTAEEYATRWAIEKANEQSADEMAMNKFYSDAFGDELIYSIEN
ncbi:hypothetical protein [Photorhabdus khanii]|uniref:hypothetical protein n=1 Tax=Photorhabdus khanii TaxID=1004150 RepID=UPI0004AD11AA|nr:hypothetical protein [Photorhabdus khanii]